MSTTKMTTPEALVFADEIQGLEKQATPGFVVIENSTDLFTECGEESRDDVRQVADYQVDDIPYIEMVANVKLAMLFRNSAPTALRILAQLARDGVECYKGAMLSVESLMKERDVLAKRVRELETERDEARRKSDYWQREEKLLRNGR